MNLAVILLSVLIAGCGEQEQQQAPAIVDQQLEALKQAKQVEGVLQNAADAQQQTINDSVKPEGQ